VITLPSRHEANRSGDVAEWLDLEVEIVVTSNESSSAYPMCAEHSGAFHDMRRPKVSLISEASLGERDVRRFRSNIVDWRR